MIYKSIADRLRLRLNSADFAIGSPLPGEKKLAEEFGVARMGEFASDFWGAGTMFPAGRFFFRPLLHSLRTNNVQAMALLSWERGTSGHEGELRRFCRAFRRCVCRRGRRFAVLRVSFR